jgi:cephalosporin hydroxylase
MSIIDEFHKLFYGTWGDEIYTKVFYKGIPCLKYPTDLWIYQEIFFEYKPEVIVEIGTFRGGSALWLGDTVKNLDLNCKVITIDISDQAVARHPDVEYIIQNSLDSTFAENLVKLYADKRVIVILDSLHTRDHVYTEMELYKDLIKPGGYLIVEDTNLNGHPVRLDYGAGPMEAVNQFLPRHPEFVVDESRHKFLISTNIRGYLKRI